MFLEITTILMLFLVIGLNYGVVSRILKLNKHLRETEGICKRHEAYLQRRQRERKAAEREETELARKQVALENAMPRLDTEWRELKDQNTAVLGELLPQYGPEALSHLSEEPDLDEEEEEA